MCVAKVYAKYRTMHRPHCEITTTPEWPIPNIVLLTRVYQQRCRFVGDFQHSSGESCDRTLSVNMDKFSYSGSIGITLISIGTTAAVADAFCCVAVQMKKDFRLVRVATFFVSRLTDCVFRYSADCSHNKPTHTNAAFSLHAAS